MAKINIIFIIVFILIASGCASIRALGSARSKIVELEQLNEARAARYTELEGLYNSEREGNKELERISRNQLSELNGYIESEKHRLEAERLIVDSLSGIFEEGESVIEGLIRGYQLIREYFEAQEIVE